MTTTEARPLRPRPHVHQEVEDPEGWATDPGTHLWGRRAIDYDDTPPKPAPWAAIIVAVLALAGSIFMFGLHQENRMSKVEEGLLREHEANVMQDADTKEFRKEWSQVLQDIRDRQIRIEDRQVKSLGGR